MAVRAARVSKRSQSVGRLNRSLGDVPSRSLAEHNLAVSLYRKSLRTAVGQSLS